MHSAILLTFIKLPFVIKIFVLSIFEWPFYTGFTVSEHMFAVYTSIQQRRQVLFSTRGTFPQLVEHHTEDRGVASSSLTTGGVTLLCPWAKHVIRCLILVQHGKIHPQTWLKNCWLGHKGSKQATIALVRIFGWNLYKLCKTCLHGKMAWNRTGQTQY